MTLSAHQKFIDQAIRKLEHDGRFLGLAVGGSWARGDADAYSDLDLVLVMEPGRASSTFEEAKGVVESFGLCLSAFTGEHVGEPRLLICLFDDPLLHVDIHFVSLDDFPRRRENPQVAWEREGALTRVIEESKPLAEHVQLQWIEDRFWTWIHYGAQKLGRGELFEVLDTLSFLRSRVLGPLESARHGKPPRGVRRLEQFADREAKEELKATVAAYDARDCERALRAAAKMYVGLREALDPGTIQRDRRVEMASLRTLHEVSEKL